MIKIPKVIDELDWQIYFAKDNDGKDIEKPCAFTWTESKKPLTFRSAYPELKEILETSENAVKPAKSEFVQGHRKPMFSDEVKKEIIYKHTYFNTSKSELARQYKCSEKTIRNIIKNTY